jgi:hypothetical protein
VFKLGNDKRRLYLFSVAALLLSASPSFGASFAVDLFEGRRILMPLIGIGGILMAVAFLVMARRGGKSKEVEAYEKELEKFRQSIRR